MIDIIDYTGEDLRGDGYILDAEGHLFLIGPAVGPTGFVFDENLRVVEVARPVDIGPRLVTTPIRTIAV